MNDVSRGGRRARLRNGAGIRSVTARSDWASPETFPAASDGEVRRLGTASVTALTRERISGGESQALSPRANARGNAIIRRVPGRSRLAGGER